MIDPIKLALKQQIHFNLAAIIFIFTLCLSFIEIAAATIADQTKIFSEQNAVESLVREWAPLVWLAPKEKFMPGDVTEFLHHVHAERAKYHVNDALSHDYRFPDDGDVEQLYYYETTNELNTILAQHDRSPWERRHKRMYKDNYLFNYIIDLPIGEHSSNWFLVTNDDIDDLLADPSSFIYGQSPNRGNVPIYAMVTMCNSTVLNTEEDDINLNLIDSKFGRQHGTYIPVSNALLKKTFARTSTQSPLIRSTSMPNNPNNDNSKAPDARNTTVSINSTNLRSKRELSEMTTTLPHGDGITKVPDSILSTSKPIADEANAQFEQNEINSSESTKRNVDSKENVENITYPSFHVTYWMFYPYSQGKSICTLSLGPFGNLPIPQIFGVCLGTKKDFGSHVGDWEHMTLYFNGKKEPEQMYVSAHDAGAYYQYERLTGTFDFRRQETRKGILQHPNFPRTVITSKNHPVLFSAQGSHGLWTAPGKHRFVRVARLFDVNGFGTAWPTWKQVEISFDSETSGRSIGPEWLRFNGRWGNPKSKCHPLKKFGLNFCEYTDGPTGIPLKKPHFVCSKR